MKKEIEIPKGCKKIAIEVEDGKMIVSYDSLNEREFFCEETNEVEEVPSVGDFAIFWLKEKRNTAIVANLSKIDLKLSKFFASDKNGYDYAIKFRNYEQYLKVRGIYGEDEP